MAGESFIEGSKLEKNPWSGQLQLRLKIFHPNLQLCAALCLITLYFKLNDANLSIKTTFLAGIIGKLLNQIMTKALVYAFFMLRTNKALWKHKPSVRGAFLCIYACQESDL